MYGFYQPKGEGNLQAEGQTFYFPNRVLSVFYDLSLANYEASFDFLLFPIKYVIFGSFVSDL